MSDGTLSEEMEEFFRRQNIYIDGYDFGVEKVKRKLILEMYNRNEPLDKICKYTDLTLETVQDVIKDYQDEKEN